MFRTLLLTTLTLFPAVASAQMSTWDGRHDISKIEVTLVYYVPSDRKPLADWRERLDYFAGRLKQFHRREFGEQSVLTAVVRDEAFTSLHDTAAVRAGSADDTFFRIIHQTAAVTGHDEPGLKREAERRDGAFPILLVMSDVNYRPLEDFYRVRPDGDGWAFEGTLIGPQHFPGASAGGSRATFVSHLGVGWGLVSADGWRVPYRGSDCVAWHEGVGHSIGIPHPEPADDSVMSMGQYRGWINESFVNAKQKQRLGYEQPEEAFVPQDLRLFDSFTAVPEPATPKPGEDVVLNLTWPEDVNVTGLSLEVATGLRDALETIEVPDGRPDRVSLSAFDSRTPVSYRIRAKSDGGNAELWGYFQVRQSPDTIVVPLEGLAEPQDAKAYETPTAG